ncbi:MAG: PAS domain S-box protein [Elainellaceae cyanobacterium]
MLFPSSQDHGAVDRFHWSDSSCRARFEEAIDALVVIDQQGYCLDANPSASVLIGIPRQQILLSSLLTWLDVPSEDAIEEGLAFTKLLNVRGKTDGSEPIERQLRRPDGSERQVLFLVQWLASEHCYLAVLRDITRQKQANVQLQAIAQSLHPMPPRSPEVQLSLHSPSETMSGSQSREMFEALFEQSDLGVLLCSIEGKILRANAKTCEIFARAESDLRQHHLKEFTAPADLALVLHYFQELVMGDRTSFTLETCYLRHDGLPLWYSLSVVVLRDVLQMSQSVMAIVKDISVRKQLETALRDSEALMNNMVNSAAACIVRFRCLGDRTLVYEYCSDGAETVFGYTAQEFLADSTLWASRVHPEDSIGVMHTAFEHIFKEQSFKLEYRFRAKDGTQRWIAAAMSSQLDLDNNCWSVTSVDVDISDRKQAEIEIETSHRRYQDLVNSTEGIVWEADAQTFQFTFISQQAESLLGYPVERWFTEPNFWQNHIHPQDRQHVIEYCISETQQCSNHDFEYRMIAADGRVVWLRDLVTVQSESGMPTYLRGLMIDITSRKEAEGILSRYERIVSATPDGVALLNSDYVYQVVNQAYLDWHNKTQDELVGYAVADVLGQEMFAQVVKPCLDRALTGEVVRYQDWFDVEALGRQYVEVTYAPYKESDSRVAGVVVLTRNLTDLKQAEIALHRLAEKELLLVSVTHLIRRSLCLDTVLKTTVTEVRKILQVERVLVYRFDGIRNGKVIAESVDENCLSILGYKIHDPCLTRETSMRPYTRGKIQNVADVHASKLAPCYVNMLSQFGVQANLVLPILHDERVWGLLVAQHCTEPHHWEHEDIDLLEQLTIQLAIAIQQSELYERVQHLNDNLELEVEQRTEELQQALEFEALLKRITDNVRDSLDESQILQTVVTELAHGLEVKSCDTGIYSADRTTSTITHEATRSLPPSRGKTFEIATSYHADIYPFLLREQSCQFSDLVPSRLRINSNQLTILACPIVDDRQTIGDLWLFKPSSEFFSEAEVRLVEQVANQCAIALRQARLYQSAQAQVIELERLNRLKDDFLSTVSHELRTPMATIKMATQMVEMQLTQQGILGKDETSLLDQYVQILRDECQRESDLINNLLDLTRLDSDTDPLMLTTINLQTWASHIAESFISRMESQQQTFSLDIPLTLEIEVDLEYLERIISELLDNACKYTPAGHHIAMTAESHAGLIRLTVSNSGVDLPEVECDRIFDKFYRIPNNDPWKHGGTGLGLALAKKLASKINATIRAESHAHQLHLILEFLVPTSADLAID